MRLQRLRVRQFRRFRDAVTLDALSGGLNVFAGPNESGKSTLVRAIRAAFFERYKTGALTDLRPWDDSGAAPEIVVEFHHDDQDWVLRKRFLSQPRCDLRVGDERASGDAAEARIAEVFGFEFAARGSSQDKHWGVPGLMWVEQGSMQQLREPVVHAATHLRNALGDVVDELSSASGEAIIEAVETQRHLYETAGGRPRGEHQKTLEALAERRRAVDSLEQKRREYAAQVDRLNRLRSQLVREERSPPWQLLRRDAEDVAARLAEVRSWMREQEADQRSRAALVAQIDHLRDQLQRFEEDRRELQRRAVARDEAAAALARCDAMVSEACAERDAAATAYQQARVAAEALRQKSQRAAARLRMTELRRQRQDVVRAVDEATQIDAQLKKLREARALAAFADADFVDNIQRLRAATRDRDTVQAQREAIATRIEFELKEGHRLQLNDESLTGHGERLLDDVAVLDIADVGRLRIVPGGEGVAELVRRQAHLDATIREACVALAVSDLAAADARLQRLQDIERQIDAAEARLGAYAPDGLAVLQDRLMSIDHALDAVLAQHPDLDVSAEEILAAHAGTDGAETEDAGALLAGNADQTTRPSQVLTAHDDARAADDSQALQAEAALIRAEASLREAREALVAHKARLNAAQAELERASARVEGIDETGTEVITRERLSALKAEQQALNHALEHRHQCISEARPDALELDLERLEAAAREAESAYHAAARERAELETALRLLGAEGLDERYAAEQVEMQALARRVAQIEKRVNALNRLRELLIDARSRLQDRLRAPLRARLEHYLRLLFPGARVSIDEQLLPSVLKRDGDDGAIIDDLSFGAREQLGLIGRLAYADLLRDAGRPTLLILDDVLVHSDSERMARMKAPLFDAARRHQILVFTCHRDAWRDVGVSIRDLETSLKREWAEVV
ncbi:MAG: AAA family ATPase [Thioalkalivibrionaceae bacterium]